MAREKVSPPTDLVATALGTCILTMIGIAAQAMQIDLSGTKVVVRKEMVAKPVRRIGTLAVTIDVPLSLGEAQQDKSLSMSQ